MNLTIKETPPRKRYVRKPKSRKKAPKKVSVSKLMQETDRLFSLRVRQETADSEGMVRCFTCQKLFHWKKIHCGHYLSRFYKAARWDFDNARPQCMMDNLWKRGDPVVFRQNLVKEIGIERVEAVEAKRNISMKLSKEFLEEKIAQLSHI